MGRSVSTPSKAHFTAYEDFHNEECEHCNGTGKDGSCETCDREHDCEECSGTGWIEAIHEFKWDVIEPYQERLKELFPSLTECDEWIGREDHAVMENNLAYFGVSEYCGTVAYWAVPKEDDYYNPGLVGLASRWLDSVANKFHNAFGSMQRIGVMSNGCAVYQRTGAVHG